MSLINEALKKAQKMRNEPQAGANPYAPPMPVAPVSEPLSAPTPTPTPIPILVPVPHPAPRQVQAEAPSQPGGFSGRSVATIAGGAGLLACICILTTVIVLRKSSPGAAAEPTAAPAASTLPAVAQVAPSSAPATASARASSPVASNSPAQATVQNASSSAQASPVQPAPLTASAAAASSGTPALPPSSKVPSAVSVGQPVANVVVPAARNEGPVISVPTIAASKPASPATPVVDSAVVGSPVHAAPLPKEQPMIQVSGAGAPAMAVHEDASLEQAAQQFVTRTRISGIRPGVKVLINGRAYKPNDLVEGILNLRLIEIGQDRLVFADANGKRYTRSL